MEKERDATAEATAKAKAKVAHVEQLWSQSAHKIKNNLLNQCRVICPDADFGEVGLDKIVIEGCIEVAPDKDDEGVGVLDSEHADPPADP